MHDADNEMTRETMEVAAIIGALRAGGDMHGSAVFLQRHITSSIEAACRDKDAEIESWRQKWIRSTERCRDMKHERDQLRAKLDEATKVLADVSTAMLMGGDGAVGDYGWSIGKLNQARPAIRAFLASALRSHRNEEAMR